MLKKIYRFLKRAYWTLDGWRFDDLKAFLRQADQNRPTGLGDMLLLDAIIASRQSSQVRNALISAMPPAPTGVGTCNLKTLVEGEAEADVFSAWQTVAQFAEFESLRGESRLQGFEAKALPFFLGRRHYRNIVVSLGNSDHDAFVLPCVAESGLARHCPRVVLHMHDGCLWNVVDKHAQLSGNTLLSVIEKAYPDRDLDAVRRLFDEETSKWRIVEGLVGMEMYGLRQVVELVKPHVVMMNSAAALQIVRRDFSGTGIPCPLEMSHHPIFASDLRTRPYLAWNGHSMLRVGSFGIPAKGKSTDDAIAACVEIAKNGIPVTLVLAGFHVDEYVKRNESPPLGVLLECHSDVTDRRLLELMDSVHVAVQLRKRNLGESSGVVASLIAKSVPTIVTDIGSFSEYGDSCLTVSPDATPVAIGNAILEASQSPQRFSCSTYRARKSTLALVQQWFSDPVPVAELHRVSSSTGHRA